MKLAKKMIFTFLAVFVAMQFHRPDKNTAQGNHTASFFTETNPSGEIRAFLKNACYDCHSNNTDYPWYNNIAPISYWLANHVKHGKEELNFSEWENYSVGRKNHGLEEIIEVLERGKMPLKEYTWTHKGAKLTEEEKQSIIEWARRSKALYRLNRQLR